MTDDRIHALVDGVVRRKANTADLRSALNEARTHGLQARHDNKEVTDLRRRVAELESVVNVLVEHLISKEQ